MNSKENNGWINKIQLIFLFFFFLFFSYKVNASEYSRTESEIRDIAIDFFTEKQKNENENIFGSYQGNKGLKSVSLNYEVEKNITVFSAGDNGFIVVTDDKRAPEILAYSINSNLDISDTNIMSLLKFYSCQVEDIKRSSFKYENEIQNDVISPLLEEKGINYGQNIPYNMFTPTIELGEYIGKNSPTGCVATAAAQIMKYYDFPIFGEKDAEYILSNSFFKKHRYLTSAISNNLYEWYNILPSYSGIESDELKSPVAYLMRDLGVTLSMNYGIESGSDGKKLVQSLTRNFGFSNSLKLISKANYTTENWESILKKELRESRPVYYQGLIDINYGHAFLIDGVDEYGLYHINWGLSGLSNGYYKLGEFNPHYLQNKNIGYNSRQKAIIGIYPDTNKIKKDIEKFIFNCQNNNFLSDKTKIQQERILAFLRSSIEQIPSIDDKKALQNKLNDIDAFQINIDNSYKLNVSKWITGNINSKKYPQIYIKALINNIPKSMCLSNTKNNTWRYYLPDLKEKDDLTVTIYNKKFKLLATLKTKIGSEN